MADPFEGWAIVELMGHRRLAGFVTEHEIAGSGFLRLDIVGRDTKVDEDDGPDVALHGGFEGVYCITPTTQDIAVRLGRQCHPAPVQRYELEPPDYEDDDEPDPYEDHGDDDRF